MKAFRLLVTSLLVTLSMGVSSCGEDELESSPTTSIDTDNLFDKTDKLFAEYIKDYADIKCRFGQQGGSSVLFSGVKNKHLWFSEYDAATKQLKSEWTDIEETDTILNVYKGYGEYETVKLNYILPAFYKKTSTGDIVTLKLNGYNQTIFTFNGQSKRTKLQSDYQKNVVANDWYAESVFIGKCCYSNEGEIIYEAKEAPRFENGKIDALLISYEEGIECKGRHISKYSYKDSKTVWSTYIEPPFETASDAKISYTLLDNSTNVWQYKCEVMFYDGSKNEFTFKIDIDNGKIINNITGITLNETSKELDIIDTFQLIATIEPANATNTNIIWSSSNEEVATVNQKGLVTAKSIGETTITATTEEGNFTASATITVKMKQDISAYIETKVTANGSNSMGQFWGVLDCTISNNSTEPIALTRIVIVNGDGKTIYGKQYDNQTISPKQSHLESVQGLPAIYSPTVKWTYTYNGFEYTTSKTYQK